MLKPTQQNFFPTSSQLIIKHVWAWFEGKGVVSKEAWFQKGADILKAGF